MEFNLSTRDVGDVTIMDAAGRITRGNATTGLQQRIRELVNSGRTKLLLNLSDVSSVDSAGLGVFVAAVTQVICTQCKTRYNTVVNQTCPRCGAAAKSGNTIVTGDGAWEPTWGEFKLLKPGQRILDLLKVTKLEICFSIHDDEKTAVMSFS